MRVSGERFPDTFGKARFDRTTGKAVVMSTTETTTTETTRSGMAKLMIVTIAFTALLMAFGLTLIASGTSVA